MVFWKSKTFTPLLLIFVLAILIRFLYFPDNINFAYDQARDSYASLEILKGHFKIIGPPTTISDKIFHGPLFYYLLAPIYFFSHNSPVAGALVLRIINALCIFLVFAVASNLFSKQVGLLSAFLFAISFEQSQYSLFFGHPALGVPAVLIFYLGLSQLIFKADSKGWIIALLGLGLAVQSEDVNGLLLIVFLIFLFAFWKYFRSLKFKFFLVGLAGFLITISSFLLVELKYGFRTIKAIIEVTSLFNHQSSFNISHIVLVMKRFVSDNLIVNDKFGLTLLFLIFSLGVLIFKKETNQKAIFLGIWFFGGLLPHYLSTNFSYYYSPAASVSLLILVSFLIYQLFLRSKFFAVILFVIIISNINLSLDRNSKGPNSDIVIQPGMLISSQKLAIDYMYQKNEGQVLAVKALTIPLNINTTWSYLFEWYGKQKYGYVPIWIGPTSEGFAGNLKVENDRGNISQKQFVIIEPTVGIDQGQIDNFFREENYFTKVVEEKKFGTITVQERERY